MTSVSTKIPITVLVQTKNEEIGIAACLAGLTAFDEVIVVDSDSTDRTREIALAAGATVINFTWNGQYPKKKQWQLDNLETRNEWVLFMDADEVPQPALLEELSAIFADSRIEDVAFDIDLDYVFAGRVLKHGHRVTKRCLVRVGHVEFPVMDDLEAPGMGELEGHYQPVADGTVGKLRGRILHNDLDPVSTWFARHNKYSDWEAHLRINASLRRSIADRRTLQGRVFEWVPLKPVVFFAYAYFARAGFLDGRAGFDYALALSTYYWQIGVKTRERARLTQYSRASGNAEAGTRHPRALQFVNTVSRSDGGPARHALEVNLALNSADYPVQLIYMTRQSSDSLLDEVRRRPDFPRLEPKYLWGSTVATVSTIRAAVNSEAIILHGYYLWWVPPLTLLAWLTRTPVILMPHGSLTAFDRSKAQAKKMLFHWLFMGWFVNRYAVFVVASSLERDELPSSIERASTSIVGAGTEAVAVPDLRAPLGDPIRLLTLSRIAPKKRIDLCVRALRVLLDRGVRAQLTVAGVGAPADMRRIAALVASLKLVAAVDLVGDVAGDRKRDVFLRSDVFLLPSDDENFGLAFAEATMHGLPAIVSAKVGAATGLPRTAGEIVSSPSPESLADAIERLVKNYEGARYAAREYASRTFSWQHVASRWRTVLLEAAGTKAVRAIRTPSDSRSER